jgi:hypothetical protein
MPSVSSAFPDSIAAPAQAPIRPRWEWRVFERAPASFIDTVGPWVDTDASFEIYILSANSAHNTKIRAGQLDVKCLEDMSPNGLELWRPAFKESFPLDSDAFAPLWKIWRIRAPRLTRSSYTMRRFLADIVGPRGDVLRAVTVTKARRKLTQFDCQAERALLTAAGEQWETLALEDEDPERVLAALESLPPERPRGSNYPAWLKRVVGFPEAFTLSTRAFI